LSLPTGSSKAVGEYKVKYCSRGFGGFEKIRINGGKNISI
jgi:hypothetical protein